MSNVLFVGIKGSGMSNLALILQKQENFVFGIDSSEYFQPQEKLTSSKIEIFEEFTIRNIQHKIDKVIYSPAYENHPLVKNLKKEYPTFSYIDYLAFLTTKSRSYAVAGTHGKTTTAGATTFALSYKNREAFPFYSIFGSSLIGKPPVIYQGEEALLLEACEYKNHFLRYNLNGAIITSIDYDHPDFFNSLDDVKESFRHFALNLSKNAFLILNTDDKNVKSLKHSIENVRGDINIIPFGFYNNTLFRIEKDSLTDSYKVRITGDETYNFQYKDKTLIIDLVGAAILSTCILLDKKDINLYLNKDDIIFEEIFITLLRVSLKSLEDFKSVKGRIELKAEKDNVTYIDDYAHHPNEIYTLLTELKERYPGRKIFAIFSPHTASRTKALYKEFLEVFTLFDKLIITKTFASARIDKDKRGLDSSLVKDLNKKLLKSFKVRLGSAIFVEEKKKVALVAASMIEDGDIVVSLGASNNDNLYKEIINAIKH